MLHDLGGMAGLFFYFNIFSQIWTGFGFGFSFSAVLGHKLLWPLHQLLWLHLLHCQAHEPSVGDKVLRLGWTILSPENGLEGIRD